MFFFFFLGEFGKLQNNIILQKAFENQMFDKLQVEGYCDINPLIGYPSINKQEIVYNLKRIKSPLVKAFQSKYASSIEEFETVMLPIFIELENDYYENGRWLDEYNYFAIVFYIFRMKQSKRKKIAYIKQLYTSWNQQENECQIQMQKGIIYDASRVDLFFVRSITQYISFLKKISMKEKLLFFRGHSKVSYDLKPSLFRKDEWLTNEKKMYLELLAKCPGEFERLNSHIEKLAEMQHYGLPTRLLDITQNPLVALYFACESNTMDYGEVVIFEQNKNSIKYFQSDKVALLASLPLFSFEEQKMIYEKIATPKEFNKNSKRLVHEVRLERPGFQAEIVADDIKDAIICIPAKKNRRIENQEGAFIVCGLLEDVYEDKKEQSRISKMRLKIDNCKTTICIIDKKQELLNELDSLGINKAKIYPEIDDVADYIKNHIN